MPINFHPANGFASTRGQSAVAAGIDEDVERVLQTEICLKPWTTASCPSVARATDVFAYRI